MITLPLVTYAVYVDYGPAKGFGCFVGSIDDAADAVIEAAIKFAAPWRVERTDRGNGTVVDVTDQLIEILQHTTVAGAMIANGARAA